MATSFENKKALRFVITLGTGKFGSSNNDQIILQGFRASVDIDKAGGVQMGTLRAKIYGVSQSDMNTCTSFTMQAPRNGGYTYLPNTVKVYAIDGKAESLVFAGNIVNAWADYQSPPDVFLHIQAAAVVYGQLKPIPPRSFKGAVDVATGMVGYPTYDGYGVNLRTLYNPSIRFGGRVKVETDVQQAAGEWVVACVAHHLESEKPGGAWFSTVRLNNTGLAITGR